VTAERKGQLLGLVERVDPASTALVVIDVQNDFCHPEGLFGSTGHDLSYIPPMAERLKALIAEARQRDMLIVFVRATYDEEVLSGTLAETFVRRGHTASQCLEGSWGADWYDGIECRDAPNEIVITKHRFSAFWGTAIDLVLRSNNITSVVATGVVTSGCVDATARDAFFLDYYVTIASDCVGDPSVERQRVFVEKFGISFGAVATAEEIIGAWGTAGDGPRGWPIEVKESRVLTTLEAKTDPAHTALLLVDLQNDFCDPEGAIAKRSEDVSFITDTLPAIQELLEGARTAGVQVVHINAAYGGLYASEASLSAGAGVGATACCVPGSWGAETIAPLKPIDGEWLVTKHRFSPFPDSRLELLLRSNGIRTVVVCGVTTHCCVEATVRDACHKDYYAVVPGDCVAARTRMRHLHEASLETMGLYFATVTSSPAILDAWRRRTAEERPANA
jgi:nicotinamidase-related amidase